MRSRGGSGGRAIASGGGLRGRWPTGRWPVGRRWPSAAAKINNLVILLLDTTAPISDHDRTFPNGEDRMGTLAWVAHVLQHDAQPGGLELDKYKRKKTVTWGKPLIWLGNQDPTYAKNVDHEWIMANSKIVFIDNKLYLQD